MSFIKYGETNGAAHGIGSNPLSQCSSKVQSAKPDHEFGLLMLAVGH